MKHLGAYIAQQFTWMCSLTHLPYIQPVAIKNLLIHSKFMYERSYSRAAITLTIQYTFKDFLSKQNTAGHKKCSMWRFFSTSKSYKVNGHNQNGFKIRKV